MRLPLLLTLALLAGGAVAAPAPPERKATLDEEVVNSIRHGLRWLREQEKDGKWEGNPISARHPGGSTCLALLALLESGATVDDPAVKRGLEQLRRIDPEHTYVLALQTMVFARASQALDRDRIQRNADRLAEARQKTGWTYGAKLRGGADNSNTFYALAGLDAAVRAGARVDTKVWEEMREAFRQTQKDGGWAYRPRISEPSTLSMTATCLAGLQLCDRHVRQSASVRERDGVLAHGMVAEDAQRAQRAAAWIGEHLPARLTQEVVERDLKPAPMCTLYDLVIAGEMTGHRYFGERDWYALGARYLVKAQKDDGSWASSPPTLLSSQPEVVTSFALLFLIQGRTPVLAAKLAHGPDEPCQWNNHPTDLANLVAVTSRELFKGRPLAWQTIDVRRWRDRDKDELRLAKELGEVPVLYLTGHRLEVSTFTEALLREYVSRGGVIFAEACCGDLQFNKDFGALVKRLFPDDALAPLPRDHPIWKAAGKWEVDRGAFALQGVSHAGRTVVVYSPRRLSDRWGSLRPDTRLGKPAFQAGAAILGWATSLRVPPPRGSRLALETSAP